MRKFNVNHNIKVRLLKDGYDYLVKYHNRYAIKESDMIGVDYFKNKEDENGYLTYQFHDFASTFGKGLLLGSRLIDTDILIDEKDLKEQ